ncbi:hypothetical protein [Pseudotabrizicola sp. 4114]|uniref:hypothetical protein n=1 Tax=Pseudotabrizicola sp. 4114 TaxID=2817731 RepID=UPI002855BFDE|nr:hypothetical protein [Pseudorhodobacter sp. 4114]
MSDGTYLYRYRIEKNGHSIGLEPYEHDFWELTFDELVVHRFSAAKLDLKWVVKLLMEKGHLHQHDAVGITRLADWQSFMVAPPPEDK